MVRPESEPHILMSSGVALTLPFLAAAANRCILSKWQVGGVSSKGRSGGLENRTKEARQKCPI